MLETKTHFKNELKSAVSLILTFSIQILPRYQNHLNAPARPPPPHPLFPRVLRCDGNDFVRTDGDEDTPVIETTSALLPNCSITDHWSPLPSLVNVHTTTDHNYHPLIAAFQMIWGPVLVKLSPSRWQDAEVRTCEVLLNPEIEAGGMTVRH